MINFQVAVKSFEAEMRLKPTMQLSFTSTTGYNRPNIIKKDPLLYRYNLTRHVLKKPG